MSHQPVLPLEPFQKWGLDFVGPFHPAAAQTGKSVYTRSYGLLHEVGGGESVTRQYGALHR
jgi:hypothetical protein